jgi:hypothetical protein
MDKIDDGLKALLESGKEKGYLTYSQVNDHLPDDDANPEKIDQLLILLEDQGIELIDESEAEEREGGTATPVLDDEVRAELDLSFMTTRCACTSPRWVKFRYSSASKKSRWPRKSKSPASASAAKCSNATAPCSKSSTPLSAFIPAICRSIVR